MHARKHLQIGRCEAQAKALRTGPGYAIVPLLGPSAGTLTTALQAFTGQLQYWSKHPPTGSFTGFTSFPGKNRIEFRAGHATLGDIGILQQVSLQVCSDSR